ncbi:MAG: M48 family metallopeptidase [Candidatus Cloacimonetes bacterium]|nr:M48 family metallopeptidase [Candidatus Cloacimonadota bacterium]MBS3766893.1 M48 family metallopeptidase [Candidatus Cloacimonadota bacterium]
MVLSCKKELIKKQAFIIFKIITIPFSERENGFSSEKLNNYSTIGVRLLGKKNITLNYPLIMVSVSTTDYIIVHELTHLKYSNHSEDFWQLVVAVIPDIRIKQVWLWVKETQLLF